ncbi:MAG TPA: VOC family protein [bacterium]|nr:VOC family protein [bacterium]
MITELDADIRLEHAFLYVRDLDRALAFYATLLPGWGVRWDGRREGQRWVHFGAPGEGQPSYLSLCEGSGAPNGEHLGFTSRDVNALVARLGAAGIRPTDTAEDSRYRRVYFEDPDGHELEFVEKRG